MENIYANHADSVIFNETALPDYTCGTVDRNKESVYLCKLKELLEDISNSTDKRVVFTLNQISDNPIWYKKSKESEKLVELLIKLFKDKKAFVSTFGYKRDDKHDITTYFKSLALLTFKRFCSAETNSPDIYISSMIETLAGISVKPRKCGEIVYGRDKRRALHKALFGVDCNCSIENDKVTVEGREKIDISEYAKQNLQDGKGFYSGLCRYLDKKDYIGDYSVNIKIFVDRIIKIDSAIKNAEAYKLNASFVNNNHLSLSDVMRYFIISKEQEKFFIVNNKLFLSFTIIIPKNRTFAIAIVRFFHFLIIICYSSENLRYFCFFQLYLLPMM